VTVEATQQGNDVVVSVRDTGVGTTSSSGREGLGSRIVRTLTSQIGARLETESRPDVGTTVTIRLPLKASMETVDGAPDKP
jgi:signal transduction histidine kinase